MSHNRKALKAAIRAAAKAFEHAYLREVAAQQRSPNVEAVEASVLGVVLTTSAHVAAQAGVTKNAAGQALRKLGWIRSFRGRARVWVKP